MIFMSEFDPYDYGPEAGPSSLLLEGRLQISIAAEVLKATGLNPEGHTSLRLILESTMSSPEFPQADHPCVFMESDNAARLRTDLLQAAMEVDGDKATYREDFRIAARGLLDVIARDEDLYER